MMNSRVADPFPTFVVVTEAKIAVDVIALVVWGWVR